MVAKVNGWWSSGNQRSVQHFFIQFDVLARIDGVIEGGPAGFHDSFDVLFFHFGGQAYKIACLIDGPHQAAGVIGFKQKAAAGALFAIKVGYGVVNAAGIMGRRAEHRISGRSSAVDRRVRTKTA